MAPDLSKSLQGVGTLRSWQPSFSKKGGRRHGARGCGGQVSKQEVEGCPRAWDTAGLWAENSDSGVQDLVIS